MPGWSLHLNKSWIFNKKSVFPFIFHIKNGYYRKSVLRIWHRKLGLAMSLLSYKECLSAETLDKRT